MAVEAVGAALKFVPDPAQLFAPFIASQADLERSTTWHVLDRLNCDRLVALAIAGDEAARAQYYQLLQRPIEEDATAEDDSKSLERLIYEHAQLLRMLPALMRQSKEVLP
jgi:hypothetical protein